MAFNIVDLVKSDISDRTLDRIGQAVGMDGSRTSIAMSGALPGLLGGLAAKARQPGGASSLLDGLRGADDGLLDNPGAQLDENATQVADRGGSLLSSVLGGGSTGKLGSALGSFTGLGHDKAGSLLGMLAPIVLGALKRKFTGDNLDASGVQGLMSSQQSNIDAAMPQGFADSLRSEGFFDSIGASSNASASSSDGVPTPTPAAPPAAAQSHTPDPPAAPAAAAAGPAASPAAPRAVEAHPEPDASGNPGGGNGGGGGLPGWVLPLVAVVVLALLAFLFLGGDDEVEAPVAATGTAAGVASVTADAAAGVSEEDMAAAEAALPEGTSMAGLTGQLDEVFDTSRNALSGVTDAASAEAALPRLQEADGTLDGFLGVYRRLPDAAKGPLAQIVSTATASLAPIADTALEIPEAGPILEPVVRPMLDKLAGVES